MVYCNIFISMLSCTYIKSESDKKKAEDEKKNGYEKQRFMLLEHPQRGENYRPPFCEGAAHTIG